MDHDLNQALEPPLPHGQTESSTHASADVFELVYGTDSNLTVPERQARPSTLAATLGGTLVAWSSANSLLLHRSKAGNESNMCNTGRHSGSMK